MPGLPSSYPRQVSADEVEAALGPFDEINPIGDRSGSGECWLTRSGGDRSVIKIIVHEHEPGRFEREVEALRRLNSSRVMQVRDRGELTAAAGNFPYLRSEFVPGGSLRDRLNAGAAVPDDTELRAFVTGVLEALAELDVARIVHRDLKPENIILRDGHWEHPVVIDLGLSRLVDATSFTVYPWAGGTWPYMAPEQLRYERANHRSDVWAAAIISAEVATGSHPFRRGREPMPADWDVRLRAGPVVPGSRPAAFRDWVDSGAAYRGYRRPSARRAIDVLEAAW